ncbi:MAG TPA: AraC family transcriptional regulator [Puia sp.]|nr:AraC family transcriptional regulator [Puia sp.]
MPKKHSRPIASYNIHPGVLDVLEIVSGHYDGFSKGRYTVPHRRNSYSFFLVKTGWIRHGIDFRQYHCQPGDVFFMAPEEVYLFEATRSIGGIGMFFTPEVLTTTEASLPIIRNPQHINKIKLNAGQVAFADDLLRKMLAESGSGEPFATGIMRSCCATLLLFFSRIYQQQLQPGQASEEQTRITENFQLLLNEGWKKLPSVSAFARQLHISPGHLNQLIKQHTGKKAIEVIQEKKITEIKRLLLYSAQSIKEIAYETGFEDPGYFNRFFKKWTTLTPLEFRTQMQEKYNT